MILKTFGTSFKVLTSILYLYGFVCLLGGVIGYRKAFLEHSEGFDRPRMKHIFGIDRLKEVFSPDLWMVEMEDTNFEAKEVRMTENLVSVRRRFGDSFAGISYPRDKLVGLSKA
ncbi:MAG: hypothetical protein MUP58_01315 [Candidatus Nanohaloarchaeota archaeon QJJ-9]|nr:hypothetical protein [Candidatus Nanohaloarchaeota archaeon QJJ-9]